MTRRLKLNLIVATATWLCLMASTIHAQDKKWSRQVENLDSTESGALDWVPLAQPLDGSSGNSKDRTGNGRVLTYSQTFPPNARFGDLSKASGGSPFDSFPYQFQSYANAPQAQPLRQSASGSLKSNGGGLRTQEPTSQSFFKFEMPFRNEQLRSGGSLAPPTLQTGYQIQHSLGGTGGAQSSIFGSSSLFGQQPVFPSEYHPKPYSQALSAPQKSLHQQNYIDSALPLKTSTFKETKPLATQQSLQSVTPQVFPLDPQPESIFELNNKASTFQSPYASHQSPAAPSPASSPSAPSSSGQQQEVQLLYVPYDTLYNQQQQAQQGSTSNNNNNFDISKYNLNGGLPDVNPYQINQFYTQDPIDDFFTTSTTPRPRLTTSKVQDIFQSFGNQQYTTAKPKQKAHQPPLAMFLFRNNARPTQSDVVAALRNSNTISVIDAPTKQTPDIFVGPAGMPIPNGYVKFDLPYLSQLAQSRDLRDVPFFVAPLSYRTPNGFNKILLPEPHVGSIVVNRAKDSNALIQQDLNSYQPTTQRARPSTQRVKEPVSTNNDYYTTTSTRNPFDGSSQRGSQQQQPQHNTKYSYYYVKDPIQEVTSPKIAKQERPKKKRPQNVQIEQPSFQQQANNPYDQFNQIGNDDFFAKVQAHRPQTTSTSTSTTSTTSSTTTSTTPEPQTLFTYSTRPQVQFPSTSGQLYHDLSTESQAPQQEHLPRFTTRPPPVTTTDEEFRMKQYFRQQDAFRNRPQLVNPTSPPFEQVQYTPVSMDYEREVNIPTTTQKAFTTKGKQRVTVYTPATVPVTTSDSGYSFEDVSQQQPINHRPSYNQNEIPDGNTEYEPNPYHVPSELPPLTPDIPGLVNNLQEKDKLPTTTPLYESDPATRPTRRPLHRTRKPAVSKVTSSVSYSETESTNKHNSNRVRRPFTTRPNTDTDSTDSESNSATKRPQSSRTAIIRNPNRIRYQPTNEERQSFKIKPKKIYKGSKNNKEVQDLEYQRDVLKQNYPVFKPARKPTSPTAIPSSYDVGNTEGPTSETQQIYTVTPSNSIDSRDQGFPASLLEPMQIAEHYNDFSKDNYGPGYFPNQEDINPTEPILRNEVSPIYTTVASTTPPTTTTPRPTTTEEPITTTTTTRRSPFIRRNYPRLRTTTTTETPTTTTPSAEERVGLRARIPPRRVVKVRTRTRRPHPASSTPAPEEEEEVDEVTKKQYTRKHSRFNPEQSDASEVSEPLRRRYKQQFKLEGQESQWSPAVKIGNSENFKPLKESPKADTHNYENEPDIVTARPEGEVQKPDTYEFNVAANLGSSGGKTTLKAPNLKPEKSFAELLEEVMGKAPEDLVTAAPTEIPHTSDYFEDQKTTIAARINRRGKWKKTRIVGTGAGQNNESFEAAESQSLGSQILNSLYSGEKSTTNQAPILNTTTPLTPTTYRPNAIGITTTVTPPTVMEDYEISTPKSLEYTTFPMNGNENDDTYQESATRRMDVVQNNANDDLDTQPSLFSEVKKQLHDLFAIEESEDQAVTAALAAVGKRRQEYMSIKRTTPLTPTDTTPGAAVATTIVPTVATNKTEVSFHKDLMNNVVYATSTSTKVSSETEICYRGRCIRSEDLPANHKLH